MSDKEKEKEKEKEKGDSKPGDLGLLEEDDEFEEFPAEGENFVLSAVRFIFHSIEGLMVITTDLYCLI